MFSHVKLSAAEQVALFGRDLCLGKRRRGTACGHPALAPACASGEVDERGRDLAWVFQEPSRRCLRRESVFSACPLEAVVLSGSLANKENCVLKCFMVPFCSPEFFSLPTVIPYEKY